MADSFTPSNAVRTCYATPTKNNKEKETDDVEAEKTGIGFSKDEHRASEGEGEE
jgi:hypothetical protein